MVTLDDCIKEHQKLFIYSENMDKMEKISGEEKFFTREEKEIIHNQSLFLSKLMKMVEFSMKKVDVEDSFYIEKIHNYELKILENIKKFEREYMGMITRRGYIIKIRGSFIENIEKIKY